MSGQGSVWAALPLGRGVTVIAHDANGIGALDKPAGKLAHPNGAEADPRALLTVRYDNEREAFEWESDGARHALFLLNRLDSATSGVILVAGDEALARHVRELFRGRMISKTYVARVFGRPAMGRTVWKDRLKIEKSGGTIRGSALGRSRGPGGGATEAETVASLIRSGDKPVTSLLKLEPKTGRSHQLRIQCASHGVPIIGDQTYGDFRRNREFARATGVKRLFLHSLETSFEYEWQGRKLVFKATAPLPAEFALNL